MNNTEKGKNVKNGILQKSFGWIPSGIVCLLIVGGLFSYIGSIMGAANMLNTIMKTAHDLLLNTVFYLMAICVVMGAIGKIFMEFGVVDLLEKLLRPLMRPLYHMPGVASLGAVLTFLSDNPAIITLSKDKRFSRYFSKAQFISLTNFGTAFGMGLIVIIYMIGNGYFVESLIGLAGAFVGCAVSTRLMQRFVIKAYPAYATEHPYEEENEETVEKVEEEKAQPSRSMFVKILDALLDGGKSGVDVGIAIIPGVLIISTLVMILTFGPTNGTYTGSAYEGVELLPALAYKVDWFFRYVFGFSDPHQVAFPITALGAVGAALSLIPKFQANGWLDGNAIAVFTAIGMCWSGFLSTHTAMLDSLGYRELTPKAILSHTFGGVAAALTAHWIYLLYMLL